MKNSLVFKTSLIIIIALITIMSIVGLYIKNSQIDIINRLQINQKNYIINQLNRSEKLAISKEIEILNHLTLSITGALTNSLYNIDENAVKLTFKNFLEKDNIKAIYIFDNSSNSIFLSAWKKQNIINFSNKLPEKFNKLNSLPKFNLSVNEENLGFIKIFYNNDMIIKDILSLKEKDLEIFYNQSKEIKEVVHKKLIYQNLAFIIASIIIVLIIVLLLVRYVNKPLIEFQRGLQSFFDYLVTPSKSVEKINIDTTDEFGQMTKSVNDSIQVSVKMHAEMAQLMRMMDKNVITSETDDKGIITYVSQAFCEISGYKKEELIGKSHNIVRNPDMLSITFKNMWKILEENKTWEGEIKNCKKDGSFFWVYTIISPKCTKTGASCGYTAIRYDITDKKAIEDLTLNLENKVTLQTKDLKKQLRVVKMGERKQNELMDIIKESKKEIESIHKHTKDSIEYAALIQSAVLPDCKLLNHHFKDNFIIWHPKDTVGGDIYFFEELRDKDECLLFFIDCTGHGVPGAFVTMLVKAVEQQIIAKIMNDDTDMEISPAWIMAYFNRELKKLLKQETKESISNAGWDGGIIYYNRRTQILKFAGAETPLFYMTKDGIFNTIKGNRYSVGYKKCAMDYEYKETILKVEEGMKFWCTTDGYLDQNGGEKDFPFGKKRFGNIIKEHHLDSMEEQREIFLYKMTEYEEMIDNNDRNDDITVIGFTV